jgi:hypothetical protein
MAHKVFISYHHDNDQFYANELKDFYGRDDTFIDRSLPRRINSDDDDYILGQIRTKHLRESTVTIVLIGKSTWSRKWVDWEVYSSLRGYGERSANGLLGITLPSATKWPARLQDNYKVENGKQTGYAITTNWKNIAPPHLWRNSQGMIQRTQIEENRKKLTEWVEYAFKRRNKANTYPILNNRERLKDDLFDINNLFS